MVGVLAQALEQVAGVLVIEGFEGVDGLLTDAPVPIAGEFGKGDQGDTALRAGAEDTEAADGGFAGGGIVEVGDRDLGNFPDFGMGFHVTKGRENAAPHEPVIVLLKGAGQMPKAHRAEEREGVSRFSPDIGRVISAHDFEQGGEAGIGAVIAKFTGDETAHEKFRVGFGSLEQRHGLVAGLVAEGRDRFQAVLVVGVLEAFGDCG